MRKILIASLAAGVIAAALAAAPVAADPVIKYLEGKGLLTAAEAEALTAEVAEETKKQAPLLSLGNKLKIDGRIYAGYLDREGRGSTLEIPDGALRFTWTPADNVDVVTRWRYNNAQDNGLDQMYVRFKKILPFDPTSNLSIGKFKMDVGEEHKTDNRVGNWVGLITNSVVNMAATDWGVELAGSMVPGKLGYVVTVSNANDGDAVDNNNEKAYSAKLHFRPIKPLYFSGAYYTTDQMGSFEPAAGTVRGTSAALSIGGNRLTFADNTVTDWKRSVWKLVGRWEPIKTVRLGAAFGQFTDEAIAPAGIADNRGKFYYVEGSYDFVPKFYAAARYSSVKLDGNALARLGGFSNCNEAVRTSIGLGYRVNKNVTIKTEYTWNDGKRPGAAERTDDQFALGAAIAF